MPNKESAKKRIRQDARKRARNRWRKGIVKDGTGGKVAEEKALLQGWA